jgi:hypothetical protein
LSLQSYAASQITHLSLRWNLFSVQILVIHLHLCNNTHYIYQVEKLILLDGGPSYFSAQFKAAQRLAQDESEVSKKNIS